MVKPRILPNHVGAFGSCTGIYWLSHAYNFLVCWHIGDVVTKDVFEWVFNKLKILRAATVISRYIDDIASHKFEQERPHIPSGVECYKKQYGGSEEEIYDEFYKIIENGWKDVNQEFPRPILMRIPILNRVLNLSRVMDFFYKDGDGYTHVGKVVKDAITDVLIDLVPI